MDLYPITSALLSVCLLLCSACQFDTKPIGQYTSFAVTGVVPPIASPNVQAGSGSITGEDTLPPAVRQDAGAQINDERDAATLDDAGVGTATGGSTALPNDAGLLPSSPIGGELFGPCSESAPCSERLVCSGTSDLFPLASQPVQGYCAAPCTWSLVAASSCMQPATGDVRASCQLGTMRCELGSCQFQQCPTGLQCKQLPNLVGGDLTISFQCRP